VLHNRCSGWQFLLPAEVTVYLYGLLSPLLYLGAGSETGGQYSIFAKVIWVRARDGVCDGYSFVYFTITAMVVGMATAICVDTVIANQGVWLGTIMCHPALSHVISVDTLIVSLDCYTCHKA
jgi:hypothetical protein